MEPRPFSSKDLAYDKLAKSWRALISHYDTQRRIETLLKDWVTPDQLHAARVLEAGCGLGDFSEAIAAANPKEFIATDIAPTLVSDLAKRRPTIDCRVADLFNLEPALGDRQFDIVVCSEVIEHTPNPEKAVCELSRRVAPEGHLLISCPNRRWIWLLYLVQALGLRRHYQGYENWVRPKDLKTWVEREGLTILKAEGIHLVPWHVVPMDCCDL